MRDPITDADDILSSIGKEEPKQGKFSSKLF